MAFDKPTRNRLAAFVAEARHLITDEFTQQFQSLYGISETSLTPLDQLTGHLDDSGLAVAGLLRERIDYLVKTHPKDKDGLKAAVARLAREQAFTVLNRLAAVRMAEKRGLIAESVGNGYQSKGFKVFEQVARSGLGEIYQRYRRYLFCLFDELAVDLGVLFDRRSPQGLLFPRENTLLNLLNLLNGPDLEPFWQEDETIGWIYQYYNDPAERKKMREESAAPRNSRELAVRNQFFTPRYVVEFLTDNTLGRIWYEMTRGETRLMEQCRYLVRRPTEIFLDPGETPPETAEQEGLSQEELLRQPVYIPHRPLKDPRELRMLDPACGSMHFGLYAFDLYEVIYEEAWDRGMDALRADFPDRDALRREIPRLIIEHNIHGIDIDPRAVQIAGLSLWLRAQRNWQQQRLPARQRPQIRRSNIVCAEPMPGDKELLRKFIEQQFPAEEQPAFAFLLEKIIDRMTLAGEAGSLLRIEEEIRTAIAKARDLAQSQSAPRQVRLFPGDERPDLVEFDLRGLNDEQYWQKVEQRIYPALEAYAEQAESDGFQRRLFADDAAQGFAFIDLCRNCYEVVVMNPPFGEQTEAIKAYLANQYPRTKNNLYSAFVERAYVFCPAGMVGLISARTFVMYRDFEGFREEFLLNSARIEAFADLGWEVLDGAQVETAAFILARCDVATQSHKGLIGPFIKLLNVSVNQKGEILLAACKEPHAEKDVFFVRREHFAALPGSPLAYWASPKLVKLFSESAMFEPSLAYCGRGAAAHVFFFRLAWEIPADQSTTSNWRRLAHGGEYSPFFRENSVFIYWKDDGREVKEYILKQYPYLNGNFGWAIQDEDKYGRVGLTSGKRNERFNVQLMPAGHIFTNEGQGFIPNRMEDVWFCLGYLNSSLVSYFLALTSGLQKTWVYIRPVPVVSLDSTTRQIIESFARENFEHKRQWTTGAEESAWFVCPWTLRGIAAETIADSIKLLLHRHTEDSQTINQRRINISNAILAALNLDPSDEAEIFNDFDRHPADVAFSPWRDDQDVKVSRELAVRTVSYLVGVTYGRWDIRYVTGERPVPKLPDPFASLPVCSPGMLQGDNGLPLSPEAGRKLRAKGQYPLDVAWSGILVDDPGHPLDLEHRINDVFSLLWGDRVETIEQEACEILGVKSMRDYFRRPAAFFADHLKCYSKSRRQAPIYWPLSTAKGSYTIWLYYPRLTNQTLHTVLADFIDDSKLKDVRTEISLLREANNNHGRLEELLDLEVELLEFRAEIERIIKLPWQPNLNDGVLITAAPLWRLFRLPKWQKDLKTCWEKLEKGEYDWAHLAYAIWPKRVEEMCKKDRSIAIAHGLEHLCQVEPPKPKGKRGKKKA